MSKYNVSKSEAKRLGIKRVKLGSSKSPSKKDRGGLSKREYAAKQSGGTLNYDTGKIKVPVTKKVTTYEPDKGEISINGLGYSVAPEKQEQFLKQKGITKDVLTGEYKYIDTKKMFEKPEVKISKTTSAKKQPDTRQSIDTSRSSTSNRQKASKYSSLINNTFGIPTAQASTQARPGATGQTLSEAPNRNFVQRGWDSLYNNLFNRKDYRYESGFKDPAQDQPTGYGPNGEMYYNNYDPATSMPSSLRSDFAAPGTNFSRPGSEEAYLRGASPIAYGAQQQKETQTYGSQATPTQYNPAGIQSNIVPENRPKPQLELPQSTQYENPFTSNPFQIQAPEIAVTPEIPQQEYAPEVAPQQQYNQPTGRSALSGGALGNGAGLANNLDPETQDYMDRLQASLGGDYGKSDLEDQIKNLLDGISKRYAEEQRLGEKELGESKVSDLNKLSSLFGAYNTSDSEQRMQTEQRTQADYADALTELIARLTASKGQEITDVKNQGVQGLRDIDTAKRQAESNVADLIYKAQMEARNRALAQSNKYTSSAKTAYNKMEADIQKLLGNASNMPSGGREYAQQQATRMGYGDISSYTPNGWENAYNPSFGQQQPANLIQLDDGRLLDKNTGDIFEI